MAGQVVRQRLREAERETIFDEFAHREGEIITGSVSRVEPAGVILDLGKAEAILRTTDQSATEHYRIGQHVKAYVLEVRRTTRGPLIYVSRTHKNFLRRLFELEVPEIPAGTVEIRAIAREAGSRSKMAVSSRQEGLDPVGATVGQRGGRVQAVVAELGGEKIDVIPWSDEASVFVANALSPAQVVGVQIDEENRIAAVTVPERMLSLAIGREGQNARLAAKLTGWRIDIRSENGAAPARRWSGRRSRDDLQVPATAPRSQASAAAAVETDAGATPGCRSPTGAAESQGRCRVARARGAAPTSGARARRCRSAGCGARGGRGSRGGDAVAAARAGRSRDRLPPGPVWPAGRGATRPSSCASCAGRMAPSCSMRTAARRARRLSLPGQRPAGRLALRRSALQRALRVALPDDLRERLEQGPETVGLAMAGRPASQAMLGGPHGT